jgi:hypothetical protein
LRSTLTAALALGGLSLSLGACSNGGAASAPLPTVTGMPAPTPAPTANPASVLAKLTVKTTIASTVDTANGDQNPYGLAIAPAGTKAGGITQPGDLIDCNFNNAANVEGQGTTLEDIKPVAGSKPTRLAQGTSLLGCDAIAMGGTGAAWVAAFGANDNPIVGVTGTINPLTNSALSGPWGQAFSPTAGAAFNAAFYETNATSGSVVRIDITSNGFVYETIATGFSVNGGAPGNILAPAGLTYNPSGDILYVVDSNTSRVIAINNVSKVVNGGIQVTQDNAATITFSGPSASSAAVLYSGKPLNAPISAALLYNGDLVVGNTGDNNLVELSPFGAVYATTSIDSGPAGAIFGIASEGTSTGSTQLFFNDDNTNQVIELSAPAGTAAAARR